MPKGQPIESAHCPVTDFSVLKSRREECVSLVSSGITAFETAAESHGEILHRAEEMRHQTAQIHWVRVTVCVCVCWRMTLPW